MAQLKITSTSYVVRVGLARFQHMFTIIFESQLKSSQTRSQKTIFIPQSARFFSFPSRSIFTHEKKNHTARFRHMCAKLNNVEMSKVSGFLAGSYLERARLTAVDDRLRVALDLRQFLTLKSHENALKTFNLCTRKSRKLGEAV